MSDDDRRRSLRQQLPPSPYTIPSSDRHQRNTSSLQLQLERAIDSPGGIARSLHLINSRATKDREIEELNKQNWSPLVKAIFRFGCRTTKKGNTTASEKQLDHLIRVCRQRGISMNSGAYFGGHFHRPLIVAAYYGYYSAVQLLIELGALPNLRDGIGRNVLFAALENPTDSGKHYLRECDKRTAQILVDLGVGTSHLGLWRQSPTETLCYVNDCSPRFNSPMFFALMDKNADAVKFLCNAGGAITDKDYQRLRRRGRQVVRTRLLAMVAEVYADSSEITATSATATNKTIKSQLFDSIKSWNQHIDWSFPPTWKAAVALCGNCGLPSAIFRSHVVPFLDRDWFYPL